MSLKPRDLNRWPALLPALIAAATAAAFLPCLRNRFLDYDDQFNYLSNSSYRGLDWPQVRWMFGGSASTGNYEPLNWLLRGATFQVWGLDPAGFHFVGLALHAAAAALFYLVARRLLAAALDDEGPGVSLGAAAAALLFSLHPLRVETVAWISAQHYPLAAVFFLGAILLYLRHCADAAVGGASRPWLALSAGCFALSLLSFPIGLTLPVVLLVLDAYPLKRLACPPSWPSARPLLREKLPYFALSALAVAGILASRPFWSISQHGPLARICQSLYSAVFYLGRTAAPIRLLPLYEFPFRTDYAGPRFLLSASVFAAASAVFWTQRRRRPALLAVWAYYLVTLLPVSGVAQSGGQFVADRYSYLPALGWSLLAGGWLASRDLSGSRKASWAVAAALLAVLGAASWRQCRVWRDSDALWSYVLAIDPESPTAHIGTGNSLMRRGRREEALGHFYKALSGNPLHPEGHNNLATALAQTGKPGEALAQLREALRLKPSYAGAHYNLGLVLTDLGRLDEAAAEYRQAVRINPSYLEAHFNLAAILAMRGQLEYAIPEYRAAIAIRPDFAQAHNNLGAALAKTGQLLSAVSEYESAVALKPDFLQARCNLGVALARLQRREEATLQFREVARLAPAYLRSRSDLRPVLKSLGLG